MEETTVEQAEQIAAKEDQVERGNFVRPDIEEITSDQIDAIADAATVTIKEVVGYILTEEIDVEEYEGDEGELILDIIGENLGALIGRHGRTADSLQILVTAIAARKSSVHYPITVDVEGYKHRRKQKIVEIAHRSASRAQQSGRPVSMRPMNPAERRQVHIALREMTNVTTSSEGSGSYRHVVILPVL